MNEITLYKWTNYNAVDGWQQKQGFSLDSRMSFDFCGEVEENQYILPPGFEVAESNAGTMEIYDDQERVCVLDISKGQPLLRVHGKSIILKRKEG